MLRIAYDDNILLTCGIGDFFALECFLTKEEKESVQSILWASRARRALEGMVSIVFPNLQQQIRLLDNFGPYGSDTFCINGFRELARFGIDYDPLKVKDYSIKGLIPQVLQKSRTYQGSTICQTDLCDITQFDLPKTYCVIHPYSRNAAEAGRDLTEEELNIISKRLMVCKMMGIVLNVGNKMGNKCPNIIDLTNETSLLESVEITKRATKFVGCASCLSVIASKMISEHSLAIKANEMLRRRLWAFYYAPRDNNQFLHRSLT